MCIVISVRVCVGDGQRPIDIKPLKDAVKSCKVCSVVYLQCVYVHMCVRVVCVYVVCVCVCVVCT